MQRRSTWRRRAWFVAFAASAPLVLGACGSKEPPFANEPRPPAPINVAAYVSPDRVSASPSSFGAGPIVLIVANQSNASQEVVLSGPSVTQTVGPINPGDTGEIKVVVRPGVYTLDTRGGAIAPARITVGEERDSAQDKVLQP